MTKLAEPVADTILRILQSGMNAIIDKINAEYALLDETNPFIQTKSIPLPRIDPQAFLFGRRDVVSVYPCVIVDVGGSDIDGERFAFNWADYDHAITVDVLVQSDNEDAISRQTLRYGRAVWEVLFGNQSDVITGQPVQAISIRPKRGSASVLVKDEALYMRGWRWELEVARTDDLT